MRSRRIGRVAVQESNDNYTQASNHSYLLSDIFTFDHHAPESKGVDKFAAEIKFAY